MKFRQIFDNINLGLVTLDKDLNVTGWNEWMALNCRIDAKEILGKPLFDYFPTINYPGFHRNLQSVLRFGNLVFFSQKLHSYLFPIPLPSSFSGKFQYMQQRCSMGPLRDIDNKSCPIEGVYIVVDDVTELAYYEQQLIESNTKDGLTGVFNRRYMEAHLHQELVRSLRYLRPLSFMMIDVDHFKKVNDNLGHQFGDYVLRQLAALLKPCYRDIDTFARYGGEEFCCILPETDMDTVLLVAERFRKTVDDHVFHYNGRDAHITISIGISETGAGCHTEELLVKQADAALYEAKKNGRNRIEISHNLKKQRESYET